MSAAFNSVGFNCVDVHMNDLISGKYDINNFRGLVACGGFSYGDVFGAGVGWASNIKNNKMLHKSFKKYFKRDDVFTLGVCNGCQMISLLTQIIPDFADLHSRSDASFVENDSEIYESRIVNVKINKSPSIFFKDMENSILPVHISHGQGKSLTTSSELSTLVYVDDDNNPTEAYPYNPNGSVRGIAGFTNKSGTITIMMPHPERYFLHNQNSWDHNSINPHKHRIFSPWIKFFQNAALFLTQKAEPFAKEA